MIDLTKQFFVTICKHANSDFYDTHKSVVPLHVKEKIKHNEINLNELRKIYLKLLEIESTYFNLEHNPKFNREKLNYLRERILELKTVINRIETSILGSKENSLSDNLKQLSK